MDDDAGAGEKKIINALDENPVCALAQMYACVPGGPLRPAHELPVETEGSIPASSSSSSSCDSPAKSSPWASVCPGASCHRRGKHPRPNLNPGSTSWAPAFLNRKYCR